MKEGFLHINFRVSFLFLLLSVFFRHIIESQEGCGVDYACLSLSLLRNMITMIYYNDDDVIIEKEEKYPSLLLRDSSWKRWAWNSISLVFTRVFGDLDPLIIHSKETCFNDHILAIITKISSCSSCPSLIILFSLTVHPSRQSLCNVKSKLLMTLFSRFLKIEVFTEDTKKALSMRIYGLLCLFLVEPLLFEPAIKKNIENTGNVRFCV